MAFQPILTSGEQVEHDIDLVISKKFELRLLLTDVAAYWPDKKAFAISDAVITRKAKLEQIASVEIGRTSRVPAFVFGACIALAGVTLLVAQVTRWESHSQHFKYPLIMLAGGVFFSLAGGHRRKLTILLRNREKDYRWISPAAFGGGVNNQVDSALAQIAEWARAHSVNLKDKRRIGPAEPSHGRPL